MRKNLSEIVNEIHLSCIEKLFQSNLNWFMKTKSRQTIDILTTNQNKIDSGFLGVMVASIECVIYLFVGLCIFNYLNSGIVLIFTFGILYWLRDLLDVYLKVFTHFYFIKRKAYQELLEGFTVLVKNSNCFKGVNKYGVWEKQFFLLNDNFTNAVIHLRDATGKWLNMRKLMLNEQFQLLCKVVPIAIMAVNPDYFNSTNVWAISMAITWGMKSYTNLRNLMDNLVELHTNCMIVRENYQMLDHKSVERT